MEYDGSHVAVGVLLGYLIVDLGVDPPRRILKGKHGNYGYADQANQMLPLVLRPFQI